MNFDEAVESQVRTRIALPDVGEAHTVRLPCHLVFRRIPQCIKPYIECALCTTDIVGNKETPPGLTSAGSPEFGDRRLPRAGSHTRAVTAMEVKIQGFGRFR